MAAESKSKIQQFGKKGAMIYIPATVRDDSLNPFKIGDAVTIRVDGKRMIIEQREGGAP